MLFIPYTGLVLFEHKDWSYEELRSAKIEKASHTKAAENSLAFESVGDFIREKFVDLSGLDDIAIFNFVIMEQLLEQEFEMLDTTFHELLPKERILFQDTNDEKMTEKFKALHTKKLPLTIENTLPFIFSQYMFLDRNKLHFANRQQRAFIDKELLGFENLKAPRQSGKTTALIQKALLEKLKHPQKRISLVTPTHFQAELLKQTLLELVERSSVVLDMNEITVYTPMEILDEHKNKREYADLLLVDDASLMEEEFIRYIKEAQKEKTLLLVNALQDSQSISFTESYYGEIEFIGGSEFPTLMKTLVKVANKDEKSDILIFAVDQNFEAMKEDLESFTAQTLSYIDTEESLREQNNTRVKLCRYDMRIPLHASYVFLIQPCQSEYEALEYLAKSSRIKSFIIYEDECDTIKKLKTDLSRN